MAKTFRPYVPEQDVLLPPGLREWLPTALTRSSRPSGCAMSAADSDLRWLATCDDGRCHLILDGDREHRSMDTARYVLAVVLLVSTPISIGLWYAIHPLARLWRRIGPVWTYTVLAVPSSLIVWLLWRTRDGLLGADLGTQPALLAVAIPSAVAGAAIARVRRRQLPSRILTGIPELSSADTGRLVTEGIYARIRNPRYVELLSFVLAYVACANYAGIWVLYALAFPAIHAVVLLEERELADRFGAEYQDYCRRVPRYVPRRRVEP